MFCWLCLMNKKLINVIVLLILRLLILQFFLYFVCILACLFSLWLIMHGYLDLLQRNQSRRISQREKWRPCGLLLWRNQRSYWCFIFNVKQSPFIFSYQILCFGCKDWFDNFSIIENNIKFTHNQKWAQITTKDLFNVK